MAFKTRSCARGNQQTELCPGTAPLSVTGKWEIVDRHFQVLLWSFIACRAWWMLTVFPSRWGKGCPVQATSVSPTNMVCELFSIPEYPRAFQKKMPLYRCPVLAVSCFLSFHFPDTDHSGWVTIGGEQIQIDDLKSQLWEFQSDRIKMISKCQKMS